MLAIYKVVNIRQLKNKLINRIQKKLKQQIKIISTNVNFHCIQNIRQFIDHNFYAEVNIQKCLFITVILHSKF